MFAKYPVDLGLVSPPIGDIRLEPRHHIGVQPQRDLLLHGSTQEAALRPGPIEDLGDVARIDLLVRKIGECVDFRPLFLGRIARI